jgi:hypothetical protein
MDYISEIISFVLGIIGGSTLTYFRMSRSQSARASGGSTAINVSEVTSGRDTHVG